MSTATSLARTPAAAARIGPGRIVERTTTITREIFLDDPGPPQTPRQSEPRSESESRSKSSSGSESWSEAETAERPIHGIDLALVRFGVWLIGLGRRHALHPAARADDIARRVEAAKAHDMRHFISLPH